MTKIIIPKLSSVSTSYESLLQKRIELRQERTTLVAGISKSLDEMRRKKHTGVNSKANERILVLLGDKTEVDDSSDKQRHDQLCQTLSDISAALEVLEDRIGNERIRASRLVSQKVEPDYKKIVGNIAKQLIELNKAAQEFTDFKNAMDAGDVSFSFLWPMPVPFANRIGPWLTEAAANDFIKKTDLPKELQ